jgi:hypothetical protein
LEKHPAQIRQLIKSKMPKIVNSEIESPKSEIK